MFLWFMFRPFLALTCQTESGDQETTFSGVGCGCCGRLLEWDINLG